MKVLKWLLLVIASLAVLLTLVGFLLPSRFRVERSAEIRAPAEKVYALIEDPRQWARWTVWNQRDPQMKMSFSGAPSGQGARWSWQSGSEGDGAMEFTRAEPGRLIEYRLSFPDFGMTSTGQLTLTGGATGTRVAWSNEGDVGANPYLHYFALLMDRMVGADFEAGLARLKALAEK
ncbi:MAG: polyketide cyclase [Betaproteobacteria bacterium]|nr:MAG: polyketide cyclase [Betaproteobacteria bacterium]